MKEIITDDGYTYWLNVDSRRFDLNGKEIKKKDE